jgi:hypothetical protein
MRVQHAGIRCGPAHRGIVLARVAGVENQAIYCPDLNFRWRRRRNHPSPHTDKLICVGRCLSEGALSAGLSNRASTSCTQCFSIRLGEKCARNLTLVACEVRKTSTDSRTELGLSLPIAVVRCQGSARREYRRAGYNFDRSARHFQCFLQF